MITEIDFKVKGGERKKLAYAIGELLGMLRVKIYQRKENRIYGKSERYCKQNC